MRDKGELFSVSPGERLLTLNKYKLKLKDKIEICFPYEPKAYTLALRHFAREIEINVLFIERSGDKIPSSANKETN